MGDKIKPNYGRDAVTGVWVPSLSQEFCAEIEKKTLLTGSDLKRFIDGLNNILSIYVSRKADSDKRPIDTPQRVNQAAIEIKEAANKLAKMLYGSAGGVQPYLEYPIYKVFNNPEVPIFLKELVLLLNAVETGCDDCMKNIRFDTKRYPSLKELVALDIRLLYTSCMKKKPSTTLSLAHESRSDYATILKLFLTEADGYAPSDGSLKKLMSWAKNNENFYKEKAKESREYFSESD